jgi:septum formation protein
MSLLFPNIISITKEDFLSKRPCDIKDPARISFVAIPSLFPENLDHSSFPKISDYAQETSRCKAEEVWLRLVNEHNYCPSIVISSDTIISFKGKIIEKPSSPDHARQILRSLSGQTHSVITGVTILYRSNVESNSICKLPFEKIQFPVETTVKFVELTNEMIDAYVATGDPL